MMMSGMKEEVQIQDRKFVMLAIKAGHIIPLFLLLRLFFNKVVGLLVHKKCFKNHRQSDLGRRHPFDFQQKNNHGKNTISL